jgi:putative oxidoreductase
MESTATYHAVPQPSADRWSDVADLVGRIMIAVIFIMAGADKLFGHTAQTVQMMQAYGVPLASLLVYPAGIIELFAGLALAVGYRARIAALALALFTVLVTPIFHAFWDVPADQVMNQMLFFTKNLAIIGGLLHILAHGARRFALKRG